ncbi:hypothetical protein D3C81_2008070 [compost metagenome]
MTLKGVIELPFWLKLNIRAGGGWSRAYNALLSKVGYICQRLFAMQPGFDVCKLELLRHIHIINTEHAQLFDPLRIRR